MIDETELLQRVLAHPASDEPKLEYAALMDAKGDPRGEFIRVQLELRRSYRGRTFPANWNRLVAREKELLAAYGEVWSAPVRPLVDECRFTLGFVDDVTVSAQGFVERAPAIVAAAPVLAIAFTGARGRCEELFSSQSLAQIRAISLWGERIGDEGVEALAESPYLGQLRYLNLVANNVTRRGLEALCRSQHLPALEYANLSGNVAPDPHDQVTTTDGHDIVEWRSPSIQQELEAKYGPRRWLHYTPQSDWFFPPLIMGLI